MNNGLVIIVIGLCIGLWLMFRKRPNVLSEFEKKDIKLKSEQDSTEKELDSIAERIKKIEDSLKDMDPKDVEDYWKNK